MGRKKTTTTAAGIHYWNAAMDKLIDRYNKSISRDERNVIYETQLHGPLMKLTENVLNRFKHFAYIFESFTDIQQMLVSHLVEQFPKYDPSKGRSFAYFSITAKNWCMQKNRSGFKHKNRFVSTDLLNSSDKEDGGSHQHSGDVVLVAKDNKDELPKEYLQQAVELWTTHLHCFPLSAKQQQFVPQVIELLQTETFRSRFAFSNLCLNNNDEPVRSKRDTFNKTIYRMTQINKGLYAYWLKHGSLKGYQFPSASMFSAKRKQQQVNRLIK